VICIINAQYPIILSIYVFFNVYYSIRYALVSLPLIINLISTLYNQLQHVCYFTVNSIHVVCVATLWHFYQGFNVV